MSQYPKKTLVASMALLAAGSVASPALAATTSKPTTLTIKAAKSSVAPKAKDTLTGTLKSGKTGVAGQTVKLEQRAVGAKAFKVVSSRKTNAKGLVTFSVTPGTKKGQKEQYELVFVATKSYKASHSAAVIVSVS